LSQIDQVVLHQHESEKSESRCKRLYLSVTPTVEEIIEEIVLEDNYKSVPQFLYDTILRYIRDREKGKQCTGG